MPTAVNTFSAYNDAPNLPPQNAAAVTTSDTVDLGYVTKNLYIGVSGDVTVIMAGGQTVTLKSVPVGMLPQGIRVTRIKATGTTATNIIALW